MIVDQFEALRDGDRYWYSLKLSRSERDMIEGLRLSDIIRLNTTIDHEIQDDVFRVGQKPIRENEPRRLRRRS